MPKWRNEFTFLRRIFFLNKSVSKIFKIAHKHKFSIKKKTNTNFQNWYIRFLRSTSTEIINCYSITSGTVKFCTWYIQIRSFERQKISLSRFKCTTHKLSETTQLNSTQLNTTYCRKLCAIISLNARYRRSNSYISVPASVCVCFNQKMWNRIVCSKRSRNRRLLLSISTHCEITLTAIKTKLSNFFGALWNFIKILFILFSQSFF